MKSRAGAAGPFIARHEVNLLAVATVKFGARSVVAKPAGSAEADGPVDQTVMRLCKCCQTSRRGFGLSPRRMTRLPLEVVMDSPMFIRKSPIEICPHCDGDALSRATEAHERRQSDS